jgi:hypothetical protein
MAEVSKSTRDRCAGLAATNDGRQFSVMPHNMAGAFEDVTCQFKALVNKRPVSKCAKRITNANFAISPSVPQVRKNTGVNIAHFVTPFPQGSCGET